MSLFGKPKQLKNLERQLTAARMSVGMFAKLPPENQQHFLDSAPRVIAQAVADAERAGHGTAAKEMLNEAMIQTPAGATEEQWRAILAGGVAELSTRQ